MKKDHHDRRKYHFSLAVLILLGITIAGHAKAAPPKINVQANYVYTTQFGFGQYSIGGLDAEVYSLPLTFSFDDVFQSATLDLFIPVTYGRYRFRTNGDFQGNLVSASADSESLAVQPMLMLKIPLSETFQISPLIAWGPGKNFGADGQIIVDGEKYAVDLNEAWFYTYQLGVSGLFRHHSGGYELLYGMAFIWAGNGNLGNGNRNQSEAYGTLYTGAEVRHPIRAHLGNIPLNAGVFVIYHNFTPSLKFTRPGRGNLSVQQIMELGVSLGSTASGNLPYVGDFLDDFRISLSYQTNQNFHGIRLNFGFPF
ncbi:hypothetical protein L4174_020145 [Photobacterium sp. CCB-ST2H9]|uniref:hypothetical protein n=1 Tax=Photobacterium sp. CCB-ST2H9 TaxID=2912855 RepID=UPI00200659D3|nr:hypothetical protein [Photobacterium sp. CCB-ST2H9]UTM59029.1 hypothetical protein L4174_020145 [Photobacterium sp. CCB-ST2H9]